MRSRQPKHRLVYSRLKKKAPTIPDITCPAIDDVISRLEKFEHRGKPITDRNVNAIKRKLEKLRTANEKLRDSGIYWNRATKDLIDRFIAKKKKPNIW